MVASENAAQQPATTQDDKPKLAVKVTQPHKHDVLFGRGNNTKHHPGNDHFLALVRMHKILYVGAPKKQKSEYAQKIVDAIHSLNPPGRFLKRCRKTESWCEVENEHALEKAMQALRDGAPELLNALMAWARHGSIAEGIPTKGTKRTRHDTSQDNKSKHGKRRKLPPFPSIVGSCHTEEQEGLMF